MFWQIMLAILLGVTSGCFTGLIPGIHINLISTIIISTLSFISRLFSCIEICSFILSMSITHTFIDSIPSIYLGAPDESQILSALPGHKMLINGQGHNAVKLTIMGSFFTLILSIGLFGLFTFLMNYIYPIIKEKIGIILIIILIYLFISQRYLHRILKSLIVFFLAGSLGLICFNIHSLNQPLFHMLSGLFGISLLFMTLFDKVSIPKQEKTKLIIRKSLVSKSVLSASVAGFFSAFLPGFGVSQAAIICTQILKKIGDKGFLILTGGLNTASMIISLCSFFVLDKARNGSVIAIKEIIEQIGIHEILLFLSIMIISGCCASILALNISRLFSSLISKINYHRTIICIIALIFFISFLFDKFIGIFILITASSLGIFTTKLNIGKNNLLGCILLPVILYLSL